MTFVKFFIFIMLSVLVSSCAPKKATKVPVKLRLFKGNISTGAAVNGGVVIVGRSEDGQDSFRFGLADSNQDVTLELKKGKWEFAAITWNGDTGLLTGINRCSEVAMVDLKDASASVSFNLNQGRCLSPFSSLGKFFSTTSYQTGSGSFFAFKPILCVNATLNSANCPEASNLTVYQSYRVSFLAEKKGSLVGTLPELHSSCRLISSAADMTLPLGVAGSDTPFGFRVGLYESTDCSGAPTGINFGSGVHHSIAGSTLRATESYSGTSTTRMFINTGAASLSGNNVQINSGAPFTASTGASVSFDPLPGSVAEICLSDVVSTASCVWTAVLTSPSAVTLPSGDGVKTVYLYSRDAMLAETLVGQDNITLDANAPVFSSGGSYSSAYNAAALPINLNWGAYTDATVVTYDVSRCASGACTSCTSLVTGHATNSFSLATLPSDGTYYICVAGVDQLGQTSSLTSVGSFAYDTAAPTSATINLNSSAAYTTTTSVSGAYSASGASEFCVSENSSAAACTPYITYAGSGGFTLSVGDGLKTVYAHYRDAAGNTTTASDTITLDATVPTTPGASMSFASDYNSGTFPVAFTWIDSTDVNLYKYHHKVCSSADCVTGCGSVTPTAGVTASSNIVSGDISGGDGAKYVCVKAEDLANQFSSYTVVASFNYDNTAPTATSFTLAGGASYSNSPTVSWATVGSVGATEMCLQNTNTTGGCSWIAAASSGSTSVIATDGTQYKYIFYRDAAGNVGSYLTDNIILDTTPPGAVTITNPSIASEVDGDTVLTDFTGGTDTNFNTFNVRLCADASCTTVFATQDFASGPQSITATPSMWPLGGTAYVVIKASDLAGNVSANAVSQPITKVLYTKVKDVALGGQHTCVALSDGRVKCWGLNSVGQLGIGNTTNVYGTNPSIMGDNLAFTINDSSFLVKNVTAGGYASCALSVDGRVKCWGSNLSGLLGLGNGTSYVNTPTILDTGLIPVTQVAMGPKHACMLNADGTVRCWGQNTYGELGYSGPAYGGGVSEYPGSLVAVDFGGSAKVVKISVGNTFACALLQDRTVKCWGKNDLGQLGQDNTTPVGGGTAISSIPYINLGGEVLDISAGDTHACAVLVSGVVKCWGDNSLGQLGTGNTTNYGSSASSMSALSGVNLGSGKRAIQVHAGGTTTCATLDDGNSRCWGNGVYGVVGQGTTAVATSPNSLALLDMGTNNHVRYIASNGANACAIIGNGNLKCWGEGNGHGQGVGTHLGDNPGEMGDTLPYVRLGTATHIDVLEIASGDNHNCALMYNGLVKCWGLNTNGQLGINQSGGLKGISPGDMGNNLAYLDLGGAVRSIASGGYQSHSTCAIMADGALKCWGLNTSGQLGIGTVSGANNIIGDDPGEVSASMAAVSFPGSLRTRAVAVGPVHTCAITADGEAYCFGGNGAGQLGVNNMTPMYSPSTAVAMSEKYIQISVGNTHSCAILRTGSPRCWGANGSAQLGLGSLTSAGDGVGTSMSVLPNILVSSSGHALKISAGLTSTCALLLDRTVKCWGYNGDGVLGQDTATPMIGDTGGLSTVYSLSVVKFTSVTATENRALDIQTNGKTSCVLMPNANVRCWGSNDGGILGQNINDINLGSGTGLSIASNIIDSVLGTFAPVEKLTLGMSACTTSGYGDAICWGANNSGQAGQGSATGNYGSAGSFVPTTAISL